MLADVLLNIYLLCLQECESILFMPDHDVGFNNSPELATHQWTTNVCMNIMYLNRRVLHVAITLMFNASITNTSNIF